MPDTGIEARSRQRIPGNLPCGPLPPERGPHHPGHLVSAPTPETTDPTRAALALFTGDRHTAPRRWAAYRPSEPFHLP